MYGNIGVDYLYRRVYAVCPRDDERAIELFINLQAPPTIGELERKLLPVLRRETESYEFENEHSHVIVTPSKAMIRNYLPDLCSFEQEGECDTESLYWIICKYNLFSENLERMARGENVYNPLTEINRRMALIHPDT